MNVQPTRAFKDAEAARVFPRPEPGSDAARLEAAWRKPGHARPWRVTGVYLLEEQHLSACATLEGARKAVKSYSPVWRQLVARNVDTGEEVTLR